MIVMSVRLGVNENEANPGEPRAVEIRCKGLLDFSEMQKECSLRVFDAL